MSFFSFPFFVQFLVFLSRVRISYSGPEHDPHYHLNIHTSCGEHGRPLITTSSSLPLLLLLPLFSFLLPPQPTTSSDFPFPCQPASQPGEGRGGAVPSFVWPVSGSLARLVFVYRDSWFSPGGPLVSPCVSPLHTARHNTGSIKCATAVCPARKVLVTTMLTIL